MANVDCPYCKGTLFIQKGYVSRISGGRRALYPYAQPCYCEINHSLNKKFGLFTQVPDATPDDAEKVHALYEPSGNNKGNYIFTGTEPSFFYTVKCFFLKGYTHKDYLILEGVNVVDRYNMPKVDGTRLTVSALDNYDLLVLLFTSRAEPPTLKACIADVLKNRQRVGKPTWVYAPTKEALLASKENSADLAHYLEAYGTIELNSTTSYKGYTPAASERMQIQNARKTQDDLGSI